MNHLRPRNIMLQRPDQRYLVMGCLLNLQRLQVLASDSQDNLWDQSDLVETIEVINDFCSEPDCIGMCLYRDEYPVVTELFNSLRNRHDEGLEGSAHLISSTI